jgi:23S rRNA pseudouridine1911/1915/1917 synthase
MKEILLCEEENVRLDVFLNEIYEDMSRNYLQKLIKNENVLINGLIRKKNYMLQSGDKIEITIPEPEELKIEPENIEIEIIYEDDYLAVVNKPRGMVVHPAIGNYTGTMVNALLFKLGNLSSINGVIRPGIVHRIDKDTTGLLVVAKDDYTHQFLSQQIKEYKANRIYKALVHGKMKESKGTINLPIGRDEKDRKKMTVTYKNSKEAITHFETIEIFKDYSYLNIKLETGRTHQIRVHLSHIGYPIVGDDIYGRKNNEFKMKGQLLHAERLSFVHPYTKKIMEFISEIPEDFKKIIYKLENRQ